MERFISIATHLTHEDLKRVSTDEKSSPALRLVNEAHTKGYNFVCLPITADSWRDRWKDMCLLPSEAEGDNVTTRGKRAETWRSRPSYMRDEVTITGLG